jgi:hypothetical protein
MRIAPKLIAAGNPENGIPKTLINGAKNPKHGERASCICDGYLTVHTTTVQVTSHRYSNHDFQHRIGAETI